MNASETAELLTVIAVGDRRTVGEADVIFWQGIVGDLRLNECKQAVQVHFRTSTDFLMPAHVRRLVTASRQDAAMRELPSGIGSSRSLEDVTKPDWFDSTVAEHRSRSRAEREAQVARGETPTFGESVVTDSDRRVSSSWRPV